MNHRQPVDLSDAFWRQMFHGAALASAFAYAYLAWRSSGYGAATLFDLYLTLGLCLAALALAITAFSRGVVSLGAVLAWGVAFRLIGLFGYPVLEDDIFRYLWDGYVLAQGASPYASVPADYFEQELSPAMTAVLDAVAYPEVGTVYGPLTQIGFALAHWVAPGQPWPLQALFAACDLAILWVLRHHAPGLGVLLYAFSPLLVKEFAFTAHADALGAACLVMALVAARGGRAAATVGIWLGLAVAAKVFALILVPLLLRFHWRGWVAWGLTLVVLYAPFAWLGAARPEGLAVMSQYWQFNAPLYYLLTGWLTPGTARLALLVVFCLAWAAYALRYIWMQPRISWPRGDVLFGLFFLCAPVVNAWYLVWLLPFAAVFPSRAAWTASFAVFLTYVTGINLNDSSLGFYDMPWWALALEYGVIALALAWDLWRPLRYPMANQQTQKSPS